MKIVILSDNPDLELRASRKSERSAPVFSTEEKDDPAVSTADLVYLDATGLEPSALRRWARALAKLRSGSAWGVLDPEGFVADPAALFQMGAADYLGPGRETDLADGARQKQVLLLAEILRAGAAAVSEGRSLAMAEDGAPAAGGIPSFPGWDALPQNKEHEFHFLYAALSDPGAIKTGIGEPGFDALQQRFRDFLGTALASAEPLLWMDSEDSLLFLLPPFPQAAARAVEACLGILLNRPLVISEDLGLEFPFDFSFALHRGRSVYRAPGRTGTLVSEDLNFIFHLGAKRGEADRISVSGEAAACLEPHFADLFVPSGTFEGRSILHSRRFLRGSFCR